jgi:hypothetical protein
LKQSPLSGLVWHVYAGVIFLPFYLMPTDFYLDGSLKQPNHPSLVWYGMSLSAIPPHATVLNLVGLTHLLWFGVA